jgi:hypothetical protein
MATKKPDRSRSSQPAAKKPAAKPEPAKQPTRLENLAAKKQASFDDLTLDDQLVDNSGVFRVTAAIAQAQTGHEDEAPSLRFASDSLVMAAQRDGFPDEPTIDESIEERSVEDEAATVERKARLATLAARARQVQGRSRR